MFFKTILVLLLSMAIEQAYAKDVALVSNKNHSETTIAMADLVKLCKAQTDKWSNGTPVTVILRDPGSAEMKLVLEKVYGMPPEALQELIKSANHGRANHPAIIVADSDEAIIRRVQSAPGAVGFVDVYSITGVVNVMKISGKLPLELGYPLHGN